MASATEAQKQSPRDAQRQHDAQKEADRQEQIRKTLVGKQTVLPRAEVTKSVPNINQYSPEGEKFLLDAGWTIAEQDESFRKMWFDPQCGGDVGRVQVKGPNENGTFPMKGGGEETRYQTVVPRADGWKDSSAQAMQIERNRQAEAKKKAQ